jgi:hypothetical protein
MNSMINDGKLAAYCRDRHAKRFLTSTVDPWHKIYYSRTLVR